MDNNTLRNLAQFTTQARKVIGRVDATKLVQDREYAKDIFKKAEEHGDEELVLLSLNVRNDLGMMAAEPTPVKEDTVSKEKYRFGARS